MPGGSGARHEVELVQLRDQAAAHSHLLQVGRLQSVRRPLRVHGDQTHAARHPWVSLVSLARTIVSVILCDDESGAEKRQWFRHVIYDVQRAR